MAGEQLLHQVADDVGRVSERLRSFSEPRLAVPASPHRSRADAARHAAQVLADAAEAFEAEHAGRNPIWRALPKVSDFGVGDMVAVTGHDLLRAAGAQSDRRVGKVPTREGLEHGDAVLQRVAAMLVEVRRRL